MKKILALLGMLTFGATAATSVVACNANQNDKEKAVLEDGSLHYYQKTITPPASIVNAKHAIVWRLLQHDKSFAHVTINDFQISTTSVDGKTKSDFSPHVLVEETMKLNEFNNTFQTEKQCLAYIASLKQSKCIRCSSFNLNTSNLRKMRCLKCHQTFSILTGTIYFHSHKHL
ncbi:Vmc-like lipoprotein signal peptide domain-containing protein [Spiroplasma endosymbiont of Virgichneumon dumeticola]|uniref:Vmc-like lipoprotein signal peptide domain-containing protein n=1 Tax=Spiroplasma endosymbiont of Virgichneumon dumeticola TaxID=3139323 RepID=UPI0035C91303